MGRLTGKCVLLTGAAGGIGEATATLFAAEGAKLVLTDIDSEKGEALSADLRRSGAQVDFIHHDVTSEADWDAVFERLLHLHGHLDVLINNAGGGTYSDIETLAYPEWSQLIRLNLDSVFLGTQRAILTMKGRGGGVIVNVSSVGGLVGTPSLVAYSSAKAGVRLLTQCVALHCGQRGYNIRVNSIHPGLIETRAGLEMASRATGLAPAEAATAFASLHPIGRLGKPEEVAKGILYLASDESSFCTGSALVVDGGYTAQ